RCLVRPCRRTWRGCWCAWRRSVSSTSSSTSTSRPWSIRAPNTSSATRLVKCQLSRTGICFSSVCSSSVLLDRSHLPSKIFRFKQRKLAKCISFSESRAVGRYILRKYKTSEANLLREGNLTEAAMVDIGIEVEIHQYYPVISSIVYECLFNPAMYGVPTNQKVVDNSLEKLKKVLEVYEARLSQNTYLAGNFLSFVDLSHFPFTFYFMATPYASLLDKYPHVKAWWDGLAARPSIKKVTAAMVLPLKA
ncbi:hypothetical protein EE612_002672, partial [Oryza sativa]